MANILNKTGITTGNTVEAYHVTQSIDAFTGTDAYDITLSGSFTVTGSTHYQGNQVTDGTITATQFIGPLNGTASMAVSSSYAVTASYAQNAPSSTSASYAATASIATSASYALSSSYAVTASYAQNALTASYAISASYEINYETSSSYAETASIAISSSYAATASFVANAQTASYVENAQTASYVENAQTASYVENAQTASYVENAHTASYVTTAQTASYVENAQTASYVENAQTASYVTLSQTASYYNETDPVFVAKSASLATTGSNTFTGDQTITGNLTVHGTASVDVFHTIYNTSSIIYASGSTQFGDTMDDTHVFTGSVYVTGSVFATASNAVSSSYAVTASYALQSTTADTASYVATAQTASYVLNAVSASRATTASYALTASYLEGYISPFPYTGSAQITGSLGVTGSITTTGNVGVGTSTPNYALDVSGEVAIRGGETSDDARIYFQASDDSNRFTIETSLTGLPSTDILGFRSINTDNILILQGDGNVGIGTITPVQKLTVAGNIQLMNNATYIYTKNSTGGTTRSFGLNGSNVLFLGSIDQPISAISLINNGSEQMYISSSGNVGIGTSIPTAKLHVDGNVIATSFTGSLLGTASYATQAATASYVETAQTASYVTLAQTASYYNGSVVSASYALSSSYAVTASYAETASFSLATTENRILVINKSGATITKGMVVHLTGSSNSSDTPYVITASYESDSLSANTLGIASQTITFNSTGYVTTEGVLTGINVTGFVSGQVLYLGPTGSIIGTAPQAPLHGVRLGQVVRDSPSNNGSIYVRIDNGYELGELHDTLDTTTTSSYGDLLVRSGSVWTNSRQLTGSYAITGSLTATSFTGSLNGTASWANNATSASFASTASYVNPLNQTLVLTGSLNTYKSGSNVVAISGSTGVLFSVDDVVSGSLFTVWTGSTPIFQVNSGLTTTVTGSLSVSGGITGSLFGTASWANNASTASFVTLAQTASYVATAQTASYVVLAQTASYVATAQTASYVLNAVSASFASTASFVNPLNQTLTLTGSFNMFKSGSTVMSVSGSTGPLLTVNDTLSGSLWRIDSGSATLFDLQSDRTLTLNGSQTITGSLNVQQGGTFAATQLTSSVVVTIPSGSATQNYSVPVVKYRSFSYLTTTRPIYEDNYIRLGYDSSGTDPELTVNTDPSAGRLQVIVFSTTTAAETVSDVNIASGTVDIYPNGIGSDERLEITVSAGQDASYPFYRITMVRSNTTYGGNIHVTTERFFTNI